MEFLDFEVRMSQDAGGAHAIAVVRAPAGEASATSFHPPDERDVKTHLLTLRAAHGFGATTRQVSDPRRELLAVPVGQTGPGESVRNLGHSLFESLLPSEIRSCYRSSLIAARSQGKGLRVRLRIESPQLAALPWEYLFDEAENEYLCLAKETPLIRYLEMPRPAPPLTISPPLRILGMVASPLDLPRLDVEKEKEHMAEAIKHLLERGQVSLTWLDGSTWRDLQKAMRGSPWNVFHFIGHGDFDATVQEGQIALEDEQGKSHLLMANQLGRLLANHESLKLVVLNSCEGARSSETDLLSSTGAVIARRGIPAVVSMQDMITDRAALEFSRMFYDALAEGLAVDEAVTEARIAISMAMVDTMEWGTPVLHMRSVDGQLFDIDASGALFPENPVPSASTVVHAPVPLLSVPPVPSASSAPEPSGLPILLRKVQKFWVEDVLDGSLGRSGLILLEVDTLPEMVDSPWGKMPLDTRQPIASLCDQLGGSFLILGVPGAGKTTVMLSLVREWVDRVARDPGLPVPVVFNLTSWADRRGALENWLTEELGTKYSIPRAAAQTWIEQNRLRVFLDGLDEVSAEHRAACVQAINKFTQSSLTGVVVCCRFNEYIELPSRLALNGAVRLRSLTREQIAAHLDRAGSRVESLRHLLQMDSSLRVLAQTPFMLSMMIRTYEDLSPGALEKQGFTSLEQRKRELMNAYVERQFRIASQGGRRG